MIRVSLQKIDAMIAEGKRPPAYRDEYLRIARNRVGDYLYVTREDQNALLAEYRGERPRKPKAPSRRKPITDEEMAEIQRRMQICGGCEHNGGIRAKAGDGLPPQYVVKCAVCNVCGGAMSLRTGRCRAGKW